WQEAYTAYQAAEPELGRSLVLALNGELPEGWDHDMPSWEAGSKPIATGKASGEVINAFAPKVPNFIGGSADLDPSTNTNMKGTGDFALPYARAAHPHRRACT